MAFPPRDKSIQGLLKDIYFRLGLVERRLTGVGGGVGGGFGEGWTDLRGFLATGITYAADGSATLAGIRARRIGGFVELSLGNLVIDTLSVPTSGNVANRTLLNAIPAKFRPLGGASIGGSWNGPIWQGHVRGDGLVILASLVPMATATANETITNLQISGTAFYPAADA